MDILSVSDAKVALFSDIHFGKSRDSIIKLSIAEKFVDYFISYLKENNIQTCFFLGDWHDNRNAISVKTFNDSYQCLKKIANVCKIYVIIGNHDTYFKDSISVNSIFPFQDIKNVKIISNLTQVNFVSKKVLLVPWKSINFDEIIENYDTAFGHFEFSGAQYTGTISSQSEFTGDILTSKISPLLFSGHYHIRKEYEYKNGKIVSIGCPFELDWGDYANPKGFYILDTNSLDYQFIENTVSPLHIKLYWSRALEKTENFKNIRNNYVKLIIDKKYKFEAVMKLVSYINTLAPIRPCETEFTYNDQFNVLEKFFDVTEDSVNMSKLDYLFKFVDNTSKETLKELDCNKLKQIINSYYTKCQEKQTLC